MLNSVNVNDSPQYTPPISNDIGIVSTISRKYTPVRIPWNVLFTWW